jgi:hypothetical protein
MRIIVALCALLSPLGSEGAGPPPAPYTAVQIDRFTTAPGVTLPADYQNALVDDIAREVSVLFQTVIIVRPGEPTPYGRAPLRISGVIAYFRPENPEKRAIIGFGSGSGAVEAQVVFRDAAGGHLLFVRGFRTSAGGLARKIAKFCNSSHLIASN